MRNRLSYFLPFAILAAVIFAGAGKTPQNDYIEKFSGIAVEEMYRSGVPASITLAQGLLESGNGLSDLAVKGNNHFGIKCHDWKGETMKVDDDRKGECFRVYQDPAESFRDHSDFLRYRSRYHFLFDYEITDYQSWANGLLKAGYATDKMYAQKLIRIIEEYDLARFDHSPASQGSGNAAIPRSPSSLEESHQIPDKALESFHFSFSRKVYELNGVPFVYSQEGDSYESIAESYDMFLNEILAYNDLSYDVNLLPGTVVYLKWKKSQAVEGMEKYVVEEDGEELRAIAQRFAVKLRSLRRLNDYREDPSFREGDTVLLRKAKKK